MLVNINSAYRQDGKDKYSILEVLKAGTYYLKVTPAVYMNTTWTSPLIFDSEGKRIQIHTYDSGCRTEKKVKPGTYYIEAPASFEKFPKKYIGLVRMFYYRKTTLKLWRVTGWNFYFVIWSTYFVGG